MKRKEFLIEVHHLVSTYKSSGSLSYFAFSLVFYQYSTLWANFLTPKSMLVILHCEQILSTNSCCMCYRNDYNTVDITVEILLKACLYTRKIKETLSIKVPSRDIFQCHLCQYIGQKSYLSDTKKLFWDR